MRKIVLLIPVLLGVGSMVSQCKPGRTRTGTGKPGGYVPKGFPAPRATGKKLGFGVEWPEWRRRVEPPKPLKVIHKTPTRLAEGLSAIAVTGEGLAVAVPAFLLTWLLVGADWPHTLSSRAGYAILYLSLFGSVLGFLWYFYLLRKVEAVKVSLLTLVTPVTALLLGHWLNDEAISAAVWWGTGLILLGLALHQWDGRRGEPVPGG